MRCCLAMLLGAVALAACEPANDAQRLNVHVQACGTGLADARIAACTLVIDAPRVALTQKVQALIDRGTLRAQGNDDTRAMSDFGLAISLDANNASAYVQRGLLHQKHGAYGPAVVDFDAADRIDDASGGGDYRDDAIKAQAQAYRAQIAQLDGRIVREANNPSLYNDRCWLRAVIGEDLKAALADCDRALALAPNTAEFLDSRGLVNLKLQSYQAALADYDAAVADEPERGHFQYGRGLARYALGMQAEAEADWRAGGAAEPGIAALYRSYGIRLPANIYALAR